MTNISSILTVIAKGKERDNCKLLIEMIAFKITSWDELFQYLILSILNQINIKAQIQLKNNSLHTESRQDGVKLPFINQLWYHVSINFTQLTIKVIIYIYMIVQLKNTMRGIISHNFYALINVYCTRFNRHALMSKILEDLMITPFEDDILRMKVI